MILKHSIISSSDAILQSPKIAAGVSGGTIATGSATWMAWIPQDIGFYASIFGWALSAVLIYTNIVGSRSRRKLNDIQFDVAMMEKEKLKQELEAMRNGRNTEN